MKNSLVLRLIFVVVAGYCMVSSAWAVDVYPGTNCHEEYNNSGAQHAINGSFQWKNTGSTGKIMCPIQWNGIIPRTITAKVLVKDSNYNSGQEVKCRLVEQKNNGSSSSSSFVSTSGTGTKTLTISHPISMQGQGVFLNCELSKAVTSGYPNAVIWYSVSQ